MLSLSYANPPSLSCILMMSISDQAEPYGSRCGRLYYRHKGKVGVVTAILFYHSVMFCTANQILLCCSVMFCIANQIESESLWRWGIILITLNQVTELAHYDMLHSLSGILNLIDGEREPSTCIVFNIPHVLIADVMWATAFKPLQPGLPGHDEICTKNPNKFFVTSVVFLRVLHQQ